MGFINADSKQAARDERDMWKRLEIDVTFAGLVVSVAAGGAAAAAGIAATVTAGPLIVTGGMVWWVKRKLISTERVVEDPPRADYHQPVVPQFHRVFREGFATDDPLQESGRRLFFRLSENVGLMEALVVANERIDGALEAGDQESAHDRRMEAMRIADRLVNRTKRLVTLGEPVAEGLRDPRLRSMATQVLPSITHPERLLDVLPEWTQAALFRAGLDVLPFLEPYPADIFNEDPLGAVAGSLEDALRSTSVLVTEVRRRLFPEAPASA
jgi:hypothetical protein